MSQTKAQLLGPVLGTVEYAGDVNFDSGTLFVDSTNNRVGIGTTNPDALLRLQGGFAKIVNGTSTLFLGDGESLVSSPPTNSSAIRFDNDNLTFSYSNNARMTITSTGNVGIGTTAPQTKLHLVNGGIVGGTGRGGNYTKTLFESNDSVGAYWEFQTTPTSTVNDILFSRGASGDYGIIGYNNSNNSMRFFTNSNQRMTIDSAGNVGIGTTNPTNTLHVYGSNSSLIIANTSTGNAGLLIRYLNGTDHGTNLLYNPGSAITYLDNTYPVSAGTVYGDMYFRQNVAGTMTERITIKGYSGNVGIGTTGPSTTLEVRKGGTNTVSGALFGGGFTQTIVSGEPQLCLVSNIDETGDFGSIEVARGGIGFSWANVADRTRFIVGTNSNHPLRLYTNASEKVRITETGNVGIGTANPQSKLHVDGNLRLGADPYIEWLSNTIRFQTVTASVPVISLRESASGNYEPRMDFYDGDGVTKNIIIDANPSYPTYFNAGNVGIGTTNPQYKLDIAGATENQIRINNTNESGHGTVNAKIVAGGSYYQVMDFHASNFQFKTYNGSSIADRFKITALGDLHSVWSDGRFIGSYYDSNYYMGFTFGVTNRELYIDNKSSDTRADIVFRTLEGAGAPVERLRIRSNGNVGIGTNQPLTKFFVKEGSSSMGFAEYNGGATIWLDGADGDISGGDYFNISANNSQQLAFGYGGGTNIVMSSTGNLGIGTTNPGVKLDVDGIIRLTASGNYTTYATRLYSRLDSTHCTVLESYLNDSTPFELIGSYGDNGGANPRVVISAGGQKVGIGITNPTAKLDVSGGGISCSGWSNNNSGTAGGLELGWDGAQVVLQSYDRVNYVYKPTLYNASRHSFLTGNVGIGTTNPTEKLSVYGSVQINQTGKALYLNSYPGIQDNTVSFEAIRADFTTGASVLEIQTKNTSNDLQRRMRILHNGVILMGSLTADAVYTTGANLPLQVEGGYNAKYINAFAGQSEILIASNFSGAVGTAIKSYVYSTGSNSYGLTLHTSPNYITPDIERLRITHDGNVGIGTTNPQSKLHVIGSIKVESGIFGETKVSGTGYTANTNLDITGFGYGNYFVNIRTTGVFHWNGILAVTMFDTADFGVSTLVSGNYSTTITASMVNLSAGNGTLRLIFNRNFDSISVSITRVG